MKPVEYLFPYGRYQILQYARYIQEDTLTMDVRTSSYDDEEMDYLQQQWVGSRELSTGLSANFPRLSRLASPASANWQLLKEDFDTVLGQA